MPTPNLIAANNKRMPSIKEIQRKLSEFNKVAQRATDPNTYASSWKRIFNQDLSADAAKGFAQYYREMRSKRSTHPRRKTVRRRTQRGGSPAPVNYQTVPGLLTNTYGSFPVEVDTDPASLDALSGGVYPPNMSIPLSRPGYWPTVPADMGNNKVGGQRRCTRKQRGGLIKSAREINRGSAVYRYVEVDNAIYDLRVTDINNSNVTFDDAVTFSLEEVIDNPEFDTQRAELEARFPDAEIVLNGGRRRGKRRNTRRCTRKQRGGNLLDSLAMRPILPYVATAYPNPAQVLSNHLSGSTQILPSPPSPVQHTWQLQGVAGAPMSPGVVTPIASDFSKLASPAPWQTTN